MFKLPRNSTKQQKHIELYASFIEYKISYIAVHHPASLSSDDWNGKKKFDQKSFFLLFLKYYTYAIYFLWLL